jgi:hypothetical protein
MFANQEYLTRAQLAEFLTARGFPISRSTLDKMAMPSRSEGPPAVGLWGNRLLYDPERALAWAKRRFVEPSTETQNVPKPGAHAPP